jgi:hypothetical protein
MLILRTNPELYNFNWTFFINKQLDDNWLAGFFWAALLWAVLLRLPIPVFRFSDQETKVGGGGSSRHAAYLKIAPATVTPFPLLTPIIK